MSRSVWLLHCDIPNTPPPPPDTEDSDMVAVGIRGHGKERQRTLERLFTFSLFFLLLFSFWLRITLGLYHHTISRLFFFLLLVLFCLALHNGGGHRSLLSFFASS